MLGDSLPYSFFTDASISTVIDGPCLVYRVSYVEYSDTWTIGLLIGGIPVSLVSPREIDNNTIIAQDDDLGIYVLLTVGASWLDPSWRDWSTDLEVEESFASSVITYGTRGVTGLATSFSDPGYLYADPDGDFYTDPDGAGYSFGASITEEPGTTVKLMAGYNITFDGSGSGILNISAEPGAGEGLVPCESGLVRTISGAAPDDKGNFWLKVVGCLELAQSPLGGEYLNTDHDLWLLGGDCLPACSDEDYQRLSKGISRLSAKFGEVNRALMYAAECMQEHYCTAINIIRDSQHSLFIVHSVMIFPTFMKVTVQNISNSAGYAVFGIDSNNLLSLATECAPFVKSGIVEDLVTGCPAEWRPDNRFDTDLITYELYTVGSESSIATLLPLQSGESASVYLVANDSVEVFDCCLARQERMVPFLTGQDLAIGLDTAVPGYASNAVLLVDPEGDNNSFLLTSVETGEAADGIQFFIADHVDAALPSIEVEDRRVIVTPGEGAGTVAASLVVNQYQPDEAFTIAANILGYAGNSISYEQLPSVSNQTNVTVSVAGSLLIVMPPDKARMIVTGLYSGNPVSLDLPYYEDINGKKRWANDPYGPDYQTLTWEEVSPGVFRWVVYDGLTGFSYIGTGDTEFPDDGSIVWAPVSGSSGFSISSDYATPAQSAATITVTPGRIQQMRVTGLSYGGEEFVVPPLIYVGTDGGYIWWTDTGDLYVYTFFVEAYDGPDPDFYMVGSNGPAILDLYSSTGTGATPDTANNWLPKLGGSNNVIGTPMVTSAASSQAQVVAAINASPGASALVTASLNGGSGDGSISTRPLESLSGGTGTPSTAAQVITAINSSPAAALMTATPSGDVSGAVARTYEAYLLRNLESPAGYDWLSDQLIDAVQRVVELGCRDGSPQECPADEACKHQMDKLMVTQETLKNLMWVRKIRYVLGGIGGTCESDDPVLWGPLYQEGDPIDQRLDELESLASILNEQNFVAPSIEEAWERYAEHVEVNWVPGYTGAPVTLPCDIPGFIGTPYGFNLSSIRADWREIQTRRGVLMQEIYDLMVGDDGSGVVIQEQNRMRALLLDNMILNALPNPIEFKCTGFVEGGCFDCGLQTYSHKLPEADITPDGYTGSPYGPLSSILQLYQEARQP